MKYNDGKVEVKPDQLSMLDPIPFNLILIGSFTMKQYPKAKLGKHHCRHENIFHTYHRKLIHSWQGNHSRV